MPQKLNYRTKSRKAILDFLESKRDITVSASDITDHLKKQDIPVDPATVYRYLNKLTAEKQVLKFNQENTQKAVYQYIGKAHDCNEHLHIKCVRCGKLMHLNCGFTSEIRAHLKEDHRFSLQCDGSILYGVCDTCEKKPSD